MSKANPPDPRPPRASAADVVAALVLAFGVFTENHRDRRAWIAAVPIVIVNYVAFRAQLRFWQAHLDRGDALLVSIALESIAIYWSYQAHQAVIADDSALRLKLAAYGMALAIGALNYSHYARPDWRPDVAAVTFGMMSVISPWLWTANSRRTSRDTLMVLNLIEPHAVRLGLTRWFWHFWRCVQVMHKATWIGENHPAEAIALADAPSRRQLRIAAARDARELAAAAAAARQAAGTSGTRAHAALAGAGAGTVLPPPAPPRRRSRQVAPRRGPGRARGRAAAVPVDEAALLAELVASGQPLPSVRALSIEKTGQVQSRPVERVLELAKAQMNGGSHP